MIDEVIGTETPPAEQGTLSTVGMWLGRFIGAAAALAIWLLVLLFLLAFLLPPNVERTVEGVPIHSSDGIGSSLGVNVLLGVLTAVYYLALLPMMLLPLREDARYNWFLFAAYGWILCLLGSLVVLRRLDLVQIGEAPLPISFRVALMVAAAIFLIPLGVGMAPAIGGARRGVYAAAMLAGGAATIGASIVFQSLGGGFAEAMTDDLPSGSAGFALLMASVLCVLIITTLLLPSLSSIWGELLSFLVLLWLFALAAVVCWMIVGGLIQRTHEAGWEMFLCLVLTGLVAPLFGWLGMPWTRGSRPAWSVCLFLAALAVLIVAFRAEFEGSPNLLRHVFDSYDGPHLIRRSSLF